MSTHRDLRQAERDVADAAEAVVAEAHHVEGSTFIAIPTAAYDDLFSATATLRTLRRALDGDAAASGRDTSIAAAKRALPLQMTLRRQVLDLIVTRHGATGEGMTTEAIELTMKRRHQSVSSAVNYLEGHALIRDSGMRRHTTTMRKAIVYVPTDLARELLAGERNINPA
jgi:hypothetical protein